MAQIIYTMKKLRKTTPQGKEILKGIWMSFYDGAKIGVLGHNGAGKSTLLRIMAGLDKDYDGEAFLSEGYTVGFLQQEPPLDPSKTVLQHVEDAVSEKKAVLARYEELSMNYSDETADEMGKAMYRYLAKQEQRHYEFISRALDYLHNQGAWYFDENELPFFEG